MADGGALKRLGARGSLPPTPPSRRAWQLNRLHSTTMNSYWVAHVSAQKITETPKIIGNLLLI